MRRLRHIGVICVLCWLAGDARAEPPVAEPVDEELADEEPAEAGPAAAAARAATPGARSAKRDVAPHARRQGVEAEAEAEDARGWARRPRRRRVVVLPTLFRGLGWVLGSAVQVVFFPIQGLVYLDDHYEVFTKVKEVFYNDAGTAGVLPTASFFSSFGLTLGATGFHNDLFGHEEELSLSAKYGGRFDQRYQLKFEAPELAQGRFYLETRLRFEQSPALFFEGIGHAPVVTMATDLSPREGAVETRFRQQRTLAVVSGGAQLARTGRSLLAGLSVIHNRREFDELDSDRVETSIGEVYDPSELVGFDHGVTTTELTADLTLDTRDTAGATGSGSRVNAFFGGVPPAGDFRFLHWGMDAAVYLTPSRPGRVLVFRVAHEGVAGDADEIPFTDLPRLGGAGLLRGWVRDRFRDRRSILGTLEYHWPMHFNISASLFTEAGKVARSFDQLLGSGLGDSWQVAYGGGLIVHGPTGVRFRIDLAYGDGARLYFSTDVLDAFRKRRKEL